MGSHQPFQFEAEDRGAQAVVIHLHGRLRGKPECFEFQETARKSAGTGRRLVLDLGDVERVDSAGVGILATLYTSAQNGGGELVLAALRPEVHRVLDVLWFLRVLRHTGTVGEALALPSETPSAGG